MHRISFVSLGSDDEVQLSDRQLDLVVDASGLIELLTRFRDGQPMHTRHAS